MEESVTEFDVSQFADVDAAQFASLVKSASKEQLETVLAGEHRRKLLDAIFGRMPGQFRADRAGSTNAVIRWNITGGPDGGTDSYDLVIADGTCKLTPPAEAEAKLAFTVGGYDFLQLISGLGNPMMMFMTGKVKAKGDLGLAANIANLFDLPKG
jgi:putative sterol carrier protein